jgi:hypothetical protein
VAAQHEIGGVRSKSCAGGDACEGRGRASESILAWRGWRDSCSRTLTLNRGARDWGKTVALTRGVGRERGGWWWGAVALRVVGKRASWICWQARPVKKRKMISDFALPFFNNAEKEDKLRKIDRSLHKI